MILGTDSKENFISFCQNLIFNKSDLKSFMEANFEKDLKSRNVDKQNVFDLAIQINHPDIIDFIQTYQEYMSIKASLPQTDNLNNIKKIKL